MAALPPRIKRRRIIIVATVVTAVLIALPLILSDAVMGEPTPDDTAPPLEVIQTVDSLAREGRWDEIDPLIDYETKGRALVPDLWDASDAEGRQKMVALLKDLFRRGWERHHHGEAFQAGVTVHETVVGEGRVRVEQVAREPDGTEVAMRYHLERRPDGWIIVDRDYRRADLVSTARLLVKSIRGQIRAQLGREPSLAEFAANAPTWFGRIRSRKFRVPEQ